MDPRVSTRGGYCVGFRDIFARLRVGLRGQRGARGPASPHKDTCVFVTGFFPSGHVAVRELSGACELVPSAGRVSLLLLVCWGGTYRWAKISWSCGGAVAPSRCWLQRIGP